MPQLTKKNFKCNLVAIFNDFRSGSPPAASGDVGEGEQFEASVMSGQHPHKSNTRSFLRFGKRAADYLRFEISQCAMFLSPIHCFQLVSVALTKCGF